MADTTPGTPQSAAREMTQYEKVRRVLDRLIAIEGQQRALEEYGTIKLDLDRVEATKILAVRRGDAEQDLRGLGWVASSPAAQQKQRLRDQVPDATDLDAARALAADPSDPCADARIERS